LKKLTSFEYVSNQIMIALAWIFAFATEARTDE